ncbi:MAG: aminotransferase class I/II-fold pyridoxal phosphate-dependent enzyme [Christensenellales bacterium]|jgi:8-amino-7-oxononanoate synthase/acyl carrier protein
MGLMLGKLEELRGDLSYRNIFSLMSNYGDKTAAEYIENGDIKTISYSEYETLARAAAIRLQKIMGESGRGGYIGIKCDNSPYWPVIFWAIMMSGHRALLLDARAPEQSSSFLLGNAGAVAIIADERIEKEGVVYISPNDILGGDDDANWQPDWADEAALCTSGTTATSRIYAYNGEAMSHQILSAEGLLKKGGLDFIYEDGELKNLAFLPLHHIFGFVAVYMWYSFFGKTIVYLKDRQPQTILETSRRLGVTHLMSVPLFWNSVAQGIMRKAKQQSRDEKLNKAIDISIFLQRLMPVAGRKIASRLFFKDVQKNLIGPQARCLISGGGHITPETLRIINGIGYPLYNGFGMTEVGIKSVEYDRNIDLRLTASLGRPFDDAQYRVEPLGAEENVGELFIRGDSLHSGVVENGVTRPRSLENGGWFATGDIARLEKGRMKIEGRLKEVIINESGENVFPDELEDAFAGLPGVERYCVLGVSDGGVYEDISLVLEMSEGAGAGQLKLAAEEIALINAGLPIYKKIQTVYVSNMPLPLANGIKVKRQQLKKGIESGAWDCSKVDMASGRALVSGGKSKKAESAEVVEGLEDIKKEIRKIFAETLVLDESEIPDDAHFIFDLGGDSLTSLSVFTRAEELFEVTLTDDEYIGCSNVNELAALLHKKLSGTEVAKPQSEEREKPLGRISSFANSREWTEFEKRIKATEAQGNPYFIAHDSVLRDTSVVDGKTVINFGSYNYLGFSGDVETVAAAKSATEKYGTSASGSRLIAGEKPLYGELEAEIAAWKHTEAALVNNAGHATNVTFVGNFCNKHDLIIYDALSHNSIMQGCQLSQSDTKAFPHNDFKALENMLKSVRDKYEKVLLVVEGVYSMDGDIAPIDEFVRLKKEYGLFLMVDEAHSSCVIGENGGGVDEYFKLKSGDIDIKMGTLSKGLGSCGGYLAGEYRLIEWLRYNLPGFVFTVGISPPLAAAALEAIRIMRRSNDRVQRLQKNIAVFITEAKKRGFDTCLAAESAITPVMIGGDAECFELSSKMLENGVFVPPAVYPAVPRNQSRLRFCLTSDHNSEQIVYALDTLHRLMQNKKA